MGAPPMLLRQAAVATLCMSQDACTEGHKGALALGTMHNTMGSTMPVPAFLSDPGSGCLGYARRA